MSDVRTIKGPCFDECDRGLHWKDGKYRWCKCQVYVITEPHERLDPETRPNVPPRMMS